MALFSNKDKRLREAFNAVHLEFEDHLDSINRNTGEILENRHMLLELQERITKLASDITDIKAQLQEPEAVQPMYEPIELSLREQEIFLTLYTADNPTSYDHLAKRLSLPVSLIQELAYEMVMKGVPIIKQRDEQGVRLSIDIEFREQQSKHNLVGIDEAVSKQLTKDLQLKLVD